MLSQFQVGLYSDTVKQYVVWKQPKNLEEAQTHAEFQELQEMGGLSGNKRDRKVPGVQGELNKEIAALKREMAQLRLATGGNDDRRKGQDREVQFTRQILFPSDRTNRRPSEQNNQPGANLERNGVGS